jgi:hypothetical protein
MEYFLSLLAFIASIIAVSGQTWDHSKGARIRFTRMGYLAVAVALIALILSFVVISKNDRAQEELDRSLKQQIENQKLELSSSQGIKESQTSQFGILEGVTEQQKEQLEGLKGLAEQQKEQLSLSSRLAESQKKQIKLSEDLTVEQRKQIRQVEKQNLDNDLLGVEISFKPSDEQWGRIAKACDRIEPLVSGFPYSASTITAEKVGGYWYINFTEIKQRKGTILPPPVSTDVPENKAFEGIIDLALIELLIKWCEDNGLVSFISRRGDYPTSVTISKDMIAFTFRPPKLHLRMSYLRDKPTVTFRGQYKETPEQTISPAPAYIRVRSLDYRVRFDEVIALNWEKKEGDSHSERWMPYISGPHNLNIDWSYFRR